MDNPANVLIVDDEPANLDILSRKLKSSGYEILSATSGIQGVEIACSAAPEIILLDIMMPGVDGYETCRRLKSSDLTKEIPVIFMTGLTDTQDKVRAFEVGALDYITKPFHTAEVLARVATHVANRQLQQKLFEQNERLLKEIEAHRRSKATVECLRDEIKAIHNFEDIVGESKSFLAILEKVNVVAETDSTVLIHGETGTGKELVARAIHHRSNRRGNPLVKVNCAAFPKGLVESEIFGHEKGAFTGATQQRKGRFELADKGTIFLDEVGELALDVQAKLLRVLQEREFERVGGEKSRQVNVRIIAATNRSLASEVEAGNFREDLYYRLNVIPIHVPPLRDRKSDIPLLTQFFIEKMARKLGRRITGVSQQSLAQLMAHSWPGNIRELENVMERSTILCQDPVIEIDELLMHDANTKENQPGIFSTLDEIDRAHILRVLTETDWLISGATGAANILGLNPSTLRGRMRKLGINKKVSVTD